MIVVSDLEKAIALLTIEHKIISPTIARKIIEKSRNLKVPLDILFSEEIQENTVLKAIAKELGTSFIDLYAMQLKYDFSAELVKELDREMLTRYSAIPMVSKEGKVVVVTSDVQELDLTIYLRTKLKGGFSIALGSKAQIQNKLALYASGNDMFGAQSTTQAAQSITQPREFIQNRSPMQDWLDSVLNKAVGLSASDIHFMFNADKSIMLRYRIDGILKIQEVPQQIKGTEPIAALITRCSTMDPTNFITPQDGTFSFNAANRQIDARVGLLPQTYGPTCVIRLLDSLNMKTRLDDMGFSLSHLRVIREKMSGAQGTILAVGPTGQGKTTTLYAMLREVNALEKNVLTVEDPVEYRLSSIGQTEIRAGLGDRSLTFAKALRSILRLDPDVILVGEIRDAETAEVAMQAAITGHLVLSSLHANSAISTYNRLNNMGLPGYLSSEALTLIISQRLLRRLHECYQVRDINNQEIAFYKSIGIEPPETVGTPVGCSGCNNTGYRGRVAAVEVLAPTTQLRELLSKNATQDKLLEYAREEGFLTIVDDGARHVREYRTTPDELTRVLATEEKE